MKNLFKLYYHISNSGDGSASVHLHQTEKEAEEADAKLSEPWGEPCNGHFKLKIEDGKLFYRKDEFIPKKGYVEQWFQVSGYQS